MSDNSMRMSVGDEDFMSFGSDSNNTTTMSIVSSDMVVDSGLPTSHYHRMGSNYRQQQDGTQLVNDLEEDWISSAFWNENPGSDLVTSGVKRSMLLPGTTTTTPTPRQDRLGFIEPTAFVPKTMRNNIHPQASAFTTMTPVPTPHPSATSSQYSVKRVAVSSGASHAPQTGRKVKICQLTSGMRSVVCIFLRHETPHLESHTALLRNKHDSTMKKKTLELRIIAIGRLRSYVSKKADTPGTNYCLTIYGKDDNDIIECKLWARSPGNYETTMLQWLHSIKYGSLVEIVGDVKPVTSTPTSYISPYNYNTQETQRLSTVPFTISGINLAIVQEGNGAYSKLYKNLLGGEYATNEFVELRTLLNEGTGIGKVMVMVKEAGDIKQFTSKKGVAMVRRTVILVDSEQTEVMLTLWGEENANASNTWVPNDTILCITNPKVEYYNNTAQLSLIEGRSYIEVDPLCPKAMWLRHLVNAAMESRPQRGLHSGNPQNPSRQPTQTGTIEDLKYLLESFSGPTLEEVRFEFVGLLSGSDLNQGTGVGATCVDCNKPSKFTLPSSPYAATFYCQECSTSNFRSPYYSSSLSFTDSTTTFHVSSMSLSDRVLGDLVGTPASEFVSRYDVYGDQFERECLLERWKVLVCVGWNASKSNIEIRVDSVARV